MSSDVEMSDVQQVSGRRSTSAQHHPPHSSASGGSHRSSLALHTDDDEHDHSEDDGEDEDEDGHHYHRSISINDGDGAETPTSPRRPISIPILVHSSPPAAPLFAANGAPPPNGSTNASQSPASASAPPFATAAAEMKPASKAAKPKSTKAKRSPSRSPPPAPPVQLQTIRLEIRLGGPENYEVDIAKEAKETGQRPPTPTPISTVKKNVESSDSESEKERDKETDGEGKKKKRKKKNAATEYYDVNDPFIDDSELAIDERTYFAQTKQQGFYVSSGEVALMKDKTPKKPKSKKPNLLGSAHHSLSHPPLGSTIKQEGTRETPIAVSDSEEQRIKHASAKAAAAGAVKAEEGEGGEQAGQKRKRYITVVEGGKKRKVVDVNSFHPELQESIEEMKKAIAEESWAQKGKFPPGLKPMLAKLALKAVQLDEYDEHFFNLMPTLFPYNKFTMTKLIKRTIFQEHTALLMERQDALLRELKQLADEGFSKAEEEWEKAVVAWDKRQEKARAESGVSGGAAESISAAPTRHPTEEMEVEHASHAPGADGHDGDEGKDGKRDLHPPGKRFRMTEQMKSIVWQLVLLSNECCRLENEKNTLEGSIIQVSEQGGRKVLYQKIVAAFPEGWMSSGQISRDVSAMKKKFEKEAMEDGA